MDDDLRTRQLQEAAERFKLLKFFPESARQFLEDGHISMSVPPWGACYWIDETTEKAVRAFELKTGGLVYTIVRTPTDLGTMDAYFYVSKTPEEWKMDRADIKDGVAFVFVNVTGGAGFSEFGTVAFRLGPAGGLLRTC